MTGPAIPGLRQVLVLDDELGVAGSPHQNAFRRATGSLPFAFVFESCRGAAGFDAGLALAALRAHPGCDLVLLDIRFGAAQDRLGHEILRALTTQFPSVPVLVMSAVERDIGELGRCLEGGALGMVGKGQGAETLGRAIDRTLAIARSHVLLGQSAPLRELRRQAARLSPYDQVPVLIVGERGTGKERVARYIHHNGPRSQAPFVAVNCAGLAESLLEAELFGAEKGAYTGADAARQGYLERAGGGVLFLDEIGNMPLATQAKLLRVLQEHSFRRVGVSAAEINVDFQVLCATNEEPEALIAAKRLREDLFDRVAVVTIRTPALRDCRGDIPELARHFLRELDPRKGKTVSADAMTALERYAWPGNARELRRVLHEAVVVSESAPVIEVSHLAPAVRSAVVTLNGRGAATGASRAPALPADASAWPQERLLAELRLAVAVKRHVQAYKGAKWKAEFMRLLYPDCRAQNAKGFSDLVRRLTKGPWGSTRLEEWEEGKALLRELDGAQGDGA